MTSGPGPLELPDEIVREAVPDDDIVLAYVTRGAMARFVEGVAAKNAEFREELLACIDGLEEAGESVSDAARAWRSPSAVVVPMPAKRAGISLRRWAPIALAAAFVLAAGGYHHAQVQEAERIQARRDREIAETQAQLAKLQAEIAAAQSELATAKSDADRKSAEAKLAAARAQQNAAASAAGKPKSSAAKAACNCQPGDPLCSCL
jgi:hypothetical protein